MFVLLFTFIVSLCQDMKIRLFSCGASAAVLWLCAGLAAASPPAPAGHTRHALQEGSEYDYIVVGAGGSGAAAAGRLARAGRRVLLLEAGGAAGLLSEIPRTAMTLQGSEADWFHETRSNNRSCLALRKRQCRYSGGRCLGGSTAINYMLYVRGNRRDYDYDLPGWSWKHFEPYFLRSEGLQSLSDLPASSEPYHNTSGAVKVGAFKNSENPWRQRILDGLKSLNFPFNPDVNARSQIGVSQVLGYVYRGERVTSASAYLESEDVRDTLHVVLGARCTGVVIDSGNVARGVSVLTGGHTKINVYAKHEVILSAGTVGTAQLLLLSGVGPASHLRKLKIPVRSDVPVGENFSDHVLPLMLIKVDRKSINFLSLLTKKGKDLNKWLSSRDGPFASIGVTDVVGFANTNCYNFKEQKLEQNYPECELPTLQIIFFYIDRYLMNVARHLVAKTFDEEVVEQILTANKDHALLVVSPILLQPRSRGWIRLNSANPLDAPAILPNYLADESDVKEIVKSIEIIKHMIQTPPFRKHNATLLQLRLRQCPDWGAAGYWACYARHMTSSAHHAVGSAALGGVLDARLRVRGVRGLRAAGLPALPRLPRGNTAAAAIALGERLADFLLEDNK